MRSTNRALNRLLLLAVGLALLIVGIATLVAGFWQGAAPAREDAAGLLRSAPEAFAEWQVDLSAIGLGVLPWLVILVPAVALVVAVLLVVLIAAQGRGRTSGIIRLRSPEGATEVDVGVGEAVIGGELSGCREIARNRIRAYRVSGRPALEIAVAVRRGGDLASVTGRAVRAVEAWDAVLGRKLPILLHLTTPRWAGLRHENRVQ